MLSECQRSEASSLPAESSHRLVFMALCYLRHCNVVVYFGIMILLICYHDIVVLVSLCCYFGILILLFWYYDVVDKLFAD